MRHLPLFFDLTDRKVLVVGQGAAAERRAELARAAGASVVEQSDGLDPSMFQAVSVAFVATGDLETVAVE